MVDTHYIPMDHLLHIKNPLPSPHHSHDHLKFRESAQAVLKVKHLLHAFILRHADRLAGALGGARSALFDLLSAKTGMISNKLRRRKTKVGKCKEHAWGSGGGTGTSPLLCLDLLPDGALPSESSTAVVRPFEEAGGMAYYYDASWNAVLHAEQLPPMITGRYLEWPEEEEEGGGCNEIDRLAERFIARCHERFVLEKQESYRRFQEMLARSL